MVTKWCEKALKIHNKGDSIISRQVPKNKYPLYLNKRAAFWIKSFIEQGKIEELYDQEGLSVEDIKEEIELLKK